MKPEILPESFETERLLIRAPRPGDGAEMNAAVLETFEELHVWMPWAQMRPSIEQSEENVRRAIASYRDGSEMRLHLFLKGTGTLVGSSGMHSINWGIPKFEIGYWCRKQFQGKGYITEAVRGITRFAVSEFGANRVEIRCDARNKPSQRVAERAGFRLEGILRNEMRAPDGTLRDTCLYAVTPDDVDAWRGTTPGE